MTTANTSQTAQERALARCYEILLRAGKRRERRLKEQQAKKKGEAKHD